MKHKTTLTENNGFIEDQENYRDMYYGKYEISHNGSGPIAVFNLFYLLTKRTDLDLSIFIQILEKNGIVLDGMCTSMIAIAKYFKDLGYVPLSSSNLYDFNKIGRETYASILSVYNPNIYYWSNAIRFWAISKENGKYYVHNNEDGSPKIAYDSITDILQKTGMKYIYLTGVYR